MLSSILYWIKAVGLVESKDPKKTIRPELKLTRLAEIINKYDPYMEDISTLWCIHWELATNEKLATFWYWIFNECNLIEFSGNRLIEMMQEYIKDNGLKNVAESSLTKDVSCFIRTYSSSDKDIDQDIEDSIDCPLAALGLIRKNKDIDNVYRWTAGTHTNMVAEIFGYTLYKFKEICYPDAIEIKLDQIRFGKYSPGRILGLSNSEIQDYIYEFGNIYEGSLNIVTTNNLNSLRINSNINSQTILINYFKKTTGLTV